MGKINFQYFSQIKIKTFLEIHFFSWYLMDFSKKNLEHCGPLRKNFKLTKVAIVSQVKFNF